MFENTKIQFKTLAMGANITCLQNMSILVSQLCSGVGRGDPFAIYVLDDFRNTFWQNTYLGYFFTNMDRKRSS
jgi:hypothetical protein